MLGGWGRKGFWLIGLPVFLILMLRTPFFWLSFIVSCALAAFWYHVVGYACSFPALWIITIIVGGTAYSVWSRVSK